MSAFAWLLASLGAAAAASPLPGYAGLLAPRVWELAAAFAEAVTDMLVRLGISG